MSHAHRACRDGVCQLLESEAIILPQTSHYCDVIANTESLLTPRAALCWLWICSRSTLIKVVSFGHQSCDEVPAHTVLCQRRLHLILDDEHVDNENVDHNHDQARSRPAFPCENKFILCRTQLIVHVDTAQFITTHMHYAWARYRVSVTAHTPLDRFILGVKVGRHTTDQGAVIPHTRVERYLINSRGCTAMFPSPVPLFGFDDYGRLVLLAFCPV